METSVYESRKTLGSKQNKLQHKKVTEVQPFKLTQPRPRSILIPEIEIPKMEKMREPPNSTYTQPPEVSLLLVKKEKNREYIEKLKAESDRLKPRCAEPIVKSVKHVSSTDDLDLNGDNYAMITTKEENADNTGSNKKKKLKCKNYVNALNTSTVINTNAVTILREWKLYLDKEKEQRKKLTELESGAFTNAAYMAWKTEEEAKIKLNQLKQIERNRLNAMISHEASSIAKHNLYCERRNNVNQLKNEKNQKLMELVKAKKLQQATMNQIAKEIASTHENAKIAKKKVMKEKRKLAAEIAKESKLLLNEAYKKAEEEKKMKKELIAKIQAEESSAIMTKSLNTKQIDLADTPGYGLLNEMSIVELRERLDQLKLKKQRELEEKRDAIQSLKEQKTKVLSEALNRISKHRSVKTVAAVGATLTNIQNASTNNNHTFTKEDIYKSDPLLQQMIDHLTKQKEERWRQLNGDQSLALRKYINKGVKRREEKPFKTFWDEMERSREMKSRAEMGATHHPSEHLITSLTV
uniref:Uncharacterized protein n=1 Tax=Trichobilharzia regenti TaxID=157069 RepID=A0AA85IQ65_TRIRE|nr:unnamed protein product [Trichobilharzia regenti]